MHRFLQRAPRIATWAVYVCFACRIMVPAGYMPAALSDGGPFVLCPGGFQGELLQFLGANEHPHHAATAAHADDDAHAATQHAHDGWTHCSIGTSLSSIALASTPLVLPALTLVSVPPSIRIHTLATATAVPHQQIRAPPSLLSA